MFCRENQVKCKIIDYFLLTIYTKFTNCGPPWPGESERSNAKTWRYWTKTTDDQRSDRVNTPGPPREDDLPGSSKLKTEEPRSRLKCGNDSAKGLGTKSQIAKRQTPELFQRSNGIFVCYIFSVQSALVKKKKDKFLVDPEPNLLYTRRKQARQSDSTLSNATSSAVRVSSDDNNVSFP